MNHNAGLSLAVTLCASCLSAPAFAGPITPPPGPVTGTYKTLTEVEPRIAINATNTRGDADSVYRITQPGSYYLTGNVAGVSGKHAIEIASSDVSIDLGGFSVVVVAGSLSGIITDGSHDRLVVRDGSVRGWGAYGVELGVSSSAGDVSRIERVHAASNGLVGIRSNQNSIIRDCVAQGNGNAGISANQGSVVESCTAVENGGVGFSIGVGGVVRGCVARANVLTGISASNGCTIVESLAESNGGGGISVASSGSIVSCVARGNTFTGIYASAASVIADCTAISNGDAGINAEGASVLDSRVHQSGGVGIEASLGALVSRCAVFGNTGDGIAVASDCVVERCVARGNGLNGTAAGIAVNGSDNRIEGNNSVDNDWGIRATSAGNFFSGNICSGNTTLNWDVVAGNFLIVINATAAETISGNSGGTSPGSTDPHANFTY